MGFIVHECDNRLPSVAFLERAAGKPQGNNQLFCLALRLLQNIILFILPCKCFSTSHALGYNTSYM